MTERMIQILARHQKYGCGKACCPRGKAESQGEGTELTAGEGGGSQDPGSPPKSRQFSKHLAQTLASRGHGHAEGTLPSARCPLGVFHLEPS